MGTPLLTASLTASKAGAAPATAAGSLVGLHAGEALLRRSRRRAPIEPPFRSLVSRLNGQLWKDGEPWRTLLRQGANQPATDLAGDFGGRGFGELCRLLAVGPYPKPLIERVADQLNPMGFASSAFQADATICW